MAREATRLAALVDKRVTVRMDDPEGVFGGTLLKIGPSGVRVKFDSPYLRERVVAAWRISPER